MCKLEDVFVQRRKRLNIQLCCTPSGILCPAALCRSHEDKKSDCSVSDWKDSKFVAFAELYVLINFYLLSRCSVAKRVELLRKTKP